MLTPSCVLSCMKRSCALRACSASLSLSACAASKLYCSLVFSDVSRAAESYLVQEEISLHRS